MLLSLSSSSFFFFFSHPFSISLFIFHFISLGGKNDCTKQNNRLYAQPQDRHTHKKKTDETQTETERQHLSFFFKTTPSPFSLLHDLPIVVIIIIIITTIILDSFIALVNILPLSIIIVTAAAAVWFRLVWCVALVLAFDADTFEEVVFSGEVQEKFLEWK